MDEDEGYLFSTCIKYEIIRDTLFSLVCNFIVISKFSFLFERISSQNEYIILALVKFCYFDKRVHSTKYVKITLLLLKDIIIYGLFMINSIIFIKIYIFIFNAVIIYL